MNTDPRPSLNALVSAATRLRQDFAEPAFDDLAAVARDYLEHPPESNCEWEIEQRFRHRAAAIRATALRIMAATRAPEEAARPLLELGRRLMSSNRAPVRRDLLSSTLLLAVGQLRDGPRGEAGSWWHASVRRSVSTGG